MYVPLSRLCCGRSGLLRCDERSKEPTSTSSIGVNVVGVPIGSVDVHIYPENTSSYVLRPSFLQLHKKFTEHE